MPENKYLNPEGVAKPKGSFTHGAESQPGSRVLYTAGQVGTAPDGTVPGDFFEQVDNIWHNLGRILEFNEMTVDDIIKVNHYLTDAEQVWPYDEHVCKYLGKTFPASTLVVIAGLVRPECLLEVDGGVKADNISRVVQAGVDVVVSGSGIFGAADYSETIAAMPAA